MELPRPYIGNPVRLILDGPMMSFLIIFAL